MKVFLILSIFSTSLFLAFAENSESKICLEKPWLCEELPCPEHEENINDDCHCKAGYTRDKETGECKGLLD